MTILTSDHILQIIPFFFSIFTLFILIRLSHFDFNIFIDFNNQIILAGDFLLIYAFCAYFFIFLQTKTTKKYNNLTRDRWHTVFPKTVISITVSYILAFLLLFYSFLSFDTSLPLIILSVLFYMSYKIINLIK